MIIGGTKALDRLDEPATAQDDPVLQVEDLKAHLHFGAGVVRAVDGISFTIRKGETLCIVGESGCGKSMTALAIMGLLPKPAGRIVGGRAVLQGVGDLARLTTKRMREIRGRAVSMVFQEPMTSLNPVFRVGWQIEEAIRVHEKLSRAEARKRAIAMLDLVGIPSPEERYKAYPHQLSGGMRQRVMIAIALACRPKLMLADEPTTALDVTIQAQILRLLNRLKSETGASLLLITHDLGVVARMATRVCVMYAGVIVEHGDVGDIFATPLHPYTQGLLASIPASRGGGERRRLNTIPGIVPSLANLPTGCRFADRCPHAYERCRKEEPPLAEPRDSSNGNEAQKVRCWLYLDPQRAGEGTLWRNA
ncbi:ABC transporter ATP-binding protein [Microvirga puerhi]|uniref:ABC transporter ATP-binding protein n=1 Tax=Microvirga puerhi TaxID=2876078 RepID=A0ABS7VSU1_9HYPH|nr:ABC transporter ATP-binding protein [Microvirga puerhi]MBZ6078264.1 ABC transporter ATP-binding protein [Microvirga puerhi]